MAIHEKMGRVSGDLWGPEVQLDPLQLLWRVVTWEYDRVTDLVHWFDGPAEVLNLSAEAAQFLIEPILVSLRLGTPWEHYDLERTLRDRDGVSVDLRIQARCLYAPDGTMSGCVGLVTDVSEQRRTERALRGVIDRYRRLVELSPDCIVVHQDGIIRYVSPAGLRLARAREPGDLVGRPILDFIHPSSLEPTLQRIASLTELGMVSEPTEAVLLCADGTPIAAEATSVRIEWEGRPAFQVILRDISERRRAEAALRYQASLVAHVSDALVATDAEGRIQSWNPAAETLYGRKVAEVLGRPFGEVLGESAVWPNGRPRAGEVEHVRADGSRLEVLVSVAPIRDELGEQTGLVAVCSDLTERIERQAAEARFSAVVAALEEGVLVVDGDGSIVSVNAAAQAMLGPWLEAGVHVDSLLGRWPLLDHEGRPLEPADHPLVVSLRTGLPQGRAVVGMIEGEETRWFSVSVRRLRDEDARAGAIVCSLCDITDRKRAEDELSFQATHDSLTRLPNRAQVLRALEAALARSRTAGSQVAVYLLDLDRFKAVNDSYGHVAGDHVLREVAARLGSVLRSDDLLGRLAGDEFVVVSPGLGSIKDARAMARRLAKAVRVPVRLSTDRQIVVTASVGIARTGGEATSAETVLSQADLAMYRAKELGRSRIELFDDELRSKVSRRALVHEELGRALDAREIRPYYQPMICAKTGRVVGVEVLARWQHRELGPIPPAEFVPVAEDTGRMVELGSQILWSACLEGARWHRSGECDPDLMVSVNLSPRQLTDPDLVTMMGEILDESGLDPRQLWLEVTESVLMDDASIVAATLADLRALGVHFAIDDFGTGYSSLAYLRRFPVEALKLDGSFVGGIGKDAEADAIVEAILRLAQSLDLLTIAEGVETADQLATLRDLGCDLLQGYLFSAPVPAARLRFTPACFATS